MRFLIKSKRKEIHGYLHVCVCMVCVLKYMYLDGNCSTYFKTDNAILHRSIKNTDLQKFSVIIFTSKSDLKLLGFSLFRIEFLQKYNRKQNKFNQNSSYTFVRFVSLYLLSCSISSEFAKSESLGK